MPLKEMSDGNHSDNAVRHEKLKFNKRKSQFSNTLGGAYGSPGGESDFTEDICLKKVKKSGDVIVLT